MMVSPSVDEVMNARNIESKYSLVIITAKRARGIQGTGVTFASCDSKNAVSVALNEIYENKVSFRTRDMARPVFNNSVLKQEIVEE